MLLLQNIIEKGESQPNLTVGILVAVVVIVLSIFLRAIFGGKKTPVSRTPLSTNYFIILYFLPSDLCFRLYVNHWIMSLPVQARVVKTDTPATETSTSQGDGENEEDKEEETSKAPRRRVKRDN